MVVSKLLKDKQIHRGAPLLKNRWFLTLVDHKLRDCSHDDDHDVLNDVADDDVGDVRTEPVLLAPE